VFPLFSKLTISGWRQFDNISIEFHPKLTILTGANGAGKSSILNLLTPHFGWQRVYLSTPKKRRAQGAPSFLQTLRPRFNAPTPLVPITSLTSAPPPMYNPATNIVGEITYSNNINAQIVVHSETQQYSPQIAGQQNILGTFIPSHRSAPVFVHVSSANANVIQAEQAYANYQSESIQRYAGNHSQGTLFKLKEALVSMAVFGPRTEFNSGDESSLEIIKGFVRILRIMLPPSLGFRNISIRVTDVILETDSGNFVVDAASGGVMSIIDVAWQIFIYSRTQQVRATRGFSVILDEPENHLHPSMQRSLLSNLIIAFPDAQFIVATHSPFIVSSVKDSSVYALRYTLVTPTYSPEDADEGPAVSKLVCSEKLDVINRAGDALEILRDVLGVPVTVPQWVEDQLDSLVNEFRTRELTPESLAELRTRMLELGFDEMFTNTLGKIVRNR
jgi:hypothetical protein